MSTIRQEVSKKIGMHVPKEAKWEAYLNDMSKEGRLDFKTLSSLIAIILEKIEAQEKA